MLGGDTSVQAHEVGTYLANTLVGFLGFVDDVYLSF